MTPNERNPRVDEFLSKESKWQSEFTMLRNILLDTPLTEDLKWGVPCYTLKGKNVVLIHGFKEYCAILLIKGSLLKDPDGILITQTENVQAGRQIRFTGTEEIRRLEKSIRAYVSEAVLLEESGAAVAFRKNTDFVIPDELQDKFASQPELRTAFEALTPGRQRAYILFFSEPKQAKTREARIEKSAPRILEGKGLND
jgi:uncharacterized protein YdeI (YjbR/CyaY-like superfamily)